MSEDTAAALDRNFTSPNESDRNFEAANVVDGLFAIARSLDHVAEAVQELASTQRTTE
jgi:hypothetical protein